MNTRHITRLSDFRLSAIVLLLLSAGVQAQTLDAQTNPSEPETKTGTTFDSNFLHNINGQPQVDLSVFSHSNRVLPGMHSVFLRLNQQPIGQRDVDFVSVPGQVDAQPCLTVPFLKELGVKTEAFPAFQTLDEKDCAGALKALPDAFTRYDHAKNILNISIPQAAINNPARGYIPPDMWDNGTTAFWTSYRASLNRTHYSGANRQNNNTTFASIRSGLNVGPWRFRVNGNYYDSGHESKWDWGDRYVERSINAWRGIVRAGDSYTSGEVFTGLRFRGVLLRSDEGMLPDSQRGYAPVIRGIASSYAKVTVRQRGAVIYSTFVPAGPFVINDLYSTPGAGDLEVEVEEVGGRTTRFMQPFAALPMLQREGIWKYNFAVGEFRHNYHASKPWLAQATGAYGLPYGLTAYGGAMIAEHNFQSAAVGVGWNLEHLGAVSLDVIGSRSESRTGDQHSGYAAHIEYAKSFPGSGTDFTLAGYRYSSAGFRSLDDVVRDRAYRINNRDYGYNRQHEYQLSMSQRVGSLSSISLNYFGVTYRNAPRDATYAQLGFNSSYGRVGYSLNYSLNRSPWNETDHTVMLSMNIPIGGRQNASYSFSHSKLNGTNNDVSLSGPLNDDYSLTYALQTGITSGSDNSNGNHGYGSIGYQSQVGTINLSHAYGRHTRSSTLDVSGAIVIDSRGPLLGQSLGETAVIVDAPNAEGLSVNNHPGVKTNSQGRALVPYATPYRENRILLTATSDDMDATLKDNIQMVVPTRGAIVLAKFDTDAGKVRLVSLRDVNGQDLPFGANVYGPDGEQRGIVGPVGRVWVTGLQADTRFVVKWGERQEHQCSFLVDPTVVQEKTDMAPRELTCAS